MRRPPPSPGSKARAERIAAALAGLLEEPVAEAASTDREASSTDPYRSVAPPDRPKTSGRVGLDCPGCAGPMTLEFEQQVEIHRCAVCSGLWLDPGELESLLAETRAQEDSTISELRDGMRSAAAPVAEVRYRKCPRCATVMDRYNYGDKSGVILDRCRTHGLFLDPGEFETIQRFIELGGHELAEKSKELRGQTEAMRKKRRELDRHHERERHHREQGARRLAWFSFFGW